MNVIYQNRVDGKRESEEHLSSLVIKGNKINCIKVKLRNGSMRSRRELEVTKTQALMLAQSYYIEQLISFSERGLLRSPEYRAKLQGLHNKAADIEKVRA